MSLPPNILNASIPQPTTQFLAPDGTVSQQWLYYFLSLGIRTSAVTPTGGGAPGVGSTGTGISSAALQAQIASSLSIEDLMEGTPVTGTLAPLMLWMASVNDQPSAPLNPLIAAMLVS